MQDVRPYSFALLASALLADEDGRFEVLPGGEASIRTRSTRSFGGPDGELEVTAYQVLGLSYNPGLVMLDEEGRFFATASPRFAMVREGYEGADEELRGWAETLSTERFVEIQAEVAREYDDPVRIRNVRVFDPEALELTDLRDVVIYGNRIASVQQANSPSPGGEVVIEGDGGTLVPGMYEMHGHFGQDNALLNIAAGVTSVRDMGNENDVLESLLGVPLVKRRPVAGSGSVGYPGGTGSQAHSSSPVRASRAPASSRARASSPR